MSTFSKFMIIKSLLKYHIGAGFHGISFCSFNVIGLNQANIGGQRNAGNQGLGIPVQGNDIPAGNHIQVVQRAVRQGNRPVQGQNGQQPAGSILEKFNFPLHQNIIEFTFN